MLNGTFQVNAGVGQFMKADPGVGRLLGVLSLQALPPERLLLPTQYSSSRSPLRTFDLVSMDLPFYFTRT